ncbi:hypothetical protein Q8G50_33205, partial [Klebsiella pneumoniae]
KKINTERSLKNTTTEPPFGFLLWMFTEKYAILRRSRHLAHSKVRKEGEIGQNTASTIKSMDIPPTSALT